MNQTRAKFGMFTTVAMIVGIVVGSGIFFKTDDILNATGGNPWLGALLLIVGAIGIMFGSLCVASYATKSSKAGGLITYIEMAWGNTAGYLAGWFQTFFYFPAITAILTWIAAIYIGLLFNITNPQDIRLWLIALAVLVTFYLLNIFTTRNAGRFQSLSTIIKIAILVILSVAGIVFGKPSNLADLPPLAQSLTPGLFTGLVACAFSYDGWFIAPSIAHEIKDPKRNLSRALIISPLIILAIYLLYFLSISYALGPQTVMALGDQAVGVFARQILGDYGSTFVYLAIIISILGSVNGVVLGFIRLPYSLAIREQFPKSTIFKTMNERLGIPTASGALSFVLALIWLGLHALSVFSVEIGFINFSSLAIDSLPIVLIYFFYLSLYIRLLIDTIKHKNQSFRQGILYPIFAMIGSLLIIYGGITQPGVLVYFLISFVGIMVGYFTIKPKHEPF